MVTEQSALALPGERRAMREVLQSYINSKLLPQHIKTVDQAEVIVSIGREIGLPAVASLRTIHLINGSPTVSPAMMLALAQRRQLIEDYKLEKSDTGATFTVLRKGMKTPHVETFTVADAQKLMLMGKDNYKKQPKTMFAWRAISAAMRVVFPDVIFGLYTPEEMGAVIELDPENELEAKVIHQDSEAVASPEAKKKAEDIMVRLAKHCDGDAERMRATLVMLTEHKKPTGEDAWVEPADLPLLVKERPEWLDAILRKMDREKIGIEAEPHDIPTENQVS